MPKTYKKPPVDHATPAIKKDKKTDAQKVDTTRSTTQSMQQSADWTGAGDLQATVKNWNSDADALEANGQAIRGLKDQLGVAEGKQRVLRRNWRTSCATVLATLNKVCAGSADKIKGFGVGVHTRNGPAPLPGLVVETGTVTGQVVGRWPKGDALHGFAVQHATDPNNASTISPVIPWAKTKFALGGSPSGSTVYVRVAPADPGSPGGVGAWSDWKSATAK